MKPKNYQHLTRLFSIFLAFVTSFRTKTVVLHNSSKERFLTRAKKLLFRSSGSTIIVISLDYAIKESILQFRVWIVISSYHFWFRVPKCTKRWKIYRNSRVIVQSFLTSSRQQLSVFIARKWNRQSGRVSRSEVLAVVNALIPTMKRRMVIVRKSNGTSALAVSVRSPRNSLASLATD